MRGVIHWVSARHGLPCRVRLYDRLFDVANPARVAEGNPSLITSTRIPCACWKAAWWSRVWTGAGGNPLPVRA